MAIKHSKSEKVYVGVCIGICVFVALLCLYPMLFTVSMSLVTGKELDANGGYILFFPRHPSIAGYQQVLMGQSFIWRALLVTLCRTVAATVLHVAVCSLTGYALSRQGLPGKQPYMVMMLVTILFGGGLIPGYMTMQKLGLMNTFWVMVIPGTFSAFDVLIFKQFFEGIPAELEDAALVDGVTEVQMFWNVILPMSKPVMAAIGLFSVVGNWNAWFDAYLYISMANSDLWPLQTFVTLMFNNLGGTANTQVAAMLEKVNAEGKGVSEISVKMALTVVAIIPVMLIYPFFQKYFTRGVYLGAVKG